MTKQALKKEKFRPNWHVQWPSNDSNCLDINANCSTGGVKGNLSLRFNDDQVVSYVPQGFVAGADSVRSPRALTAATLSLYTL